MKHSVATKTGRQVARGRAMSCWLARGGGLLAAALVVVMLYPGCDEVKNYELLSTFFDGVPVPEYLRQKQQEAAVAAGKQVKKEEKIVYRFHAPYGNRNCYGCHDREQGNGVPVNAAGLCRRCHTTYFTFETDDWVHGPVAVGLCRRCHEPHKSPYDGLLVEKQTDLCFHCHNPNFIQTDPFHSRIDKPHCSDCHDPHATGNRLLLADSRTYRRRKLRPTTDQTAHDFWKKDTCEKCHDSTQANKLRSDVSQQCLTCHTKIKQSLDDSHVHKAVRERKCVVCHTPHKTPRPHLIRPTAEKICLTCHQSADWKKPGHPNVTRVDCLICHNGHISERQHLLKPGVGLAATSPKPVMRPPAAPQPQGDER